MPKSSVIVDPAGKPARVRDPRCPKCLGDKRVASAGFGIPHPVCVKCGYEWLDEPYEETT